LTEREIKLVLRYAYPFAAEAEQLRACPSRDGWDVVRIEAFWLSQWIGGLSHSVRKVRSDVLRGKLDALCCALENAERSSSRTR
jgi:hypothetical protein